MLEELKEMQRRIDELLAEVESVNSTIEAKTKARDAISADINTLEESQMEKEGEIEEIVKIIDKMNKMAGAIYATFQSRAENLLDVAQSRAITADDILTFIQETGLKPPADPEPERQEEGHEETLEVASG